MNAIAETFIFEKDLPEQELVQKFYDTNRNIKKKFKIKRIRIALKLDQRRQLVNIASKSNLLHGLMIKTQMLSGMRVSEVANLLVTNVNFDGNYITIQNNESAEQVEEWTPKTSNSIRLIPLEQGLAIELLRFIDDRQLKWKKKSRKKHENSPMSPYLFVSRLGRKFNPRSIGNFVNDYAIQCSTIGHTIGSHAMRRTFASFMIRNGVPIGNISKYLGHKSIKTTMEYLFDIVYLDDFEKDAKILSSMF